LAASDLQITGGTVRGSLQANAAKTIWTVVVDPTPSNTGTLDLTLTSTKIATLKDAAGNPAAVTTAAAVSHDTIAPTVMFQGEASVNPDTTGKDISVDGHNVIVFDAADITGGYSIGLDYSDMFVNASIGRNTISHNSTTKTLTFDQAALLALDQGFYTINVNLIDAAGNTSTTQQVIGKNNNVKFQADQFDKTNDPGDNFFINRKDGGNTADTIVTGAGDDTIFWLRKFTGEVGASDKTILSDFDQTKDEINLRDLFLEADSGDVTTNSLKYIRFENIDDNVLGGIAETRVHISINGDFGTDATFDSSRAVQTIDVLNQQLSWNGGTTPNWLVI
jgi:predicted nucleic acid-binding protein